MLTGCLFAVPISDLMQARSCMGSLCVSVAVGTEMLFSQGYASRTTQGITFCAHWVASLVCSRFLYVTFHPVSLARAAFLLRVSISVHNQANRCASLICFGCFLFCFVS